MEIKNAIITSATISNDDHGMLSCWIHVDYGNSGQGFGGYALYFPKSNENHSIKSIAGHFIFRVMEIADVNNWNNLNGKAIRVKSDKSIIKAIGHIIKDDWFNPEKDFAEIIKEQNENSSHYPSKDGKHKAFR